MEVLHCENLNNKIIMNREELKNIIPHREPMLLVDTVETVEENLVKGSYKIRGDEFFLQGHFPEYPVVPGVILCEIMAQTSCLLLVKELKNRIPLYAGIDKVRFKNPVRPNDLFEIKASVTNRRGLIFYVHAEGFVNNKLAVAGEMCFALIDKL
jgi:3-hydroxyacyl-[acyl-carrier-protein] dehydratase